MIELVVSALMGLIAVGAVGAMWWRKASPRAYHVAAAMDTLKPILRSVPRLTPVTTPKATKEKHPTPVATRAAKRK